MAVVAGPRHRTVSALVDLSVTFPGNPPRAVAVGVVLAERVRWDEPVVLGRNVSVVAGGFNRRGGCPDQPQLAFTPGTTLLVPGVPAIHQNLSWRGIRVCREAPDMFARVEDRLGLLVATFCARVVSDRALTRYVVRVDMAGVRQHLDHLLVKLLDGPQPYDRTDMLRRAHLRYYARLRIRRHDYGRLCNHMAEALYEVGVDDVTSAFLMDRFWAGIDRWAA